MSKVEEHEDRIIDVLNKSAITSKTVIKGRNPGSRGIIRVKDIFGNDSDPENDGEDGFCFDCSENEDEVSTTTPTPLPMEHEEAKDNGRRRCRHDDDNDDNFESIKPIFKIAKSFFKAFKEA
jgi:hypothetical protein